ncbi:hypothetical protein QX776_15285 [Alteromonadaceae bacterium BrNp21-10]|nr:hypothetical protein [Alteromonadaceae bacterium BrNp21-10]
MRKSLLAIALGAMTLSAANAATNMTELSKDLDIMSNIMQTVLSQNGDKKGIRFRNLDVSYLADQGVVFKIDTRQRGFNFDFSFGDFNLREFIGQVPSVPPVPPVHDVNTQVVMDFDMEDGEVEQHVRHAMEKMQEAMSESRDHLRSLREQEREISWEQREYERRFRDIEFEKRHASDDDKKEMAQELKELEKEKLKLEAKRAEIEKYVNTLEEKQRTQLKAQREARSQQTKAFLIHFEDSIADVLCKYGAGIKSMPDSEHVSFVLSDFGDENQESKKDKVYVFKNKDIKACVAEKIDTNKLLSNANTYLF